MQARAGSAPGKFRATTTQGSGCVDGGSGGFHCPRVWELSPPGLLRGSSWLRCPPWVLEHRGGWWELSPALASGEKLHSISDRFLFFCFIVLSSLTSLLSTLLPSFLSALLPFPSIPGQSCCYFVSD